MLKAADFEHNAPRATAAKSSSATACAASRPHREVPITFTDRVRGHSKMSLSVGIEELGLVTWWGIRDRVRVFLKRSR